MKTLLHLLSSLLIAIVSVFRLGAREECHNVASTVGTHANGVLPLAAEVTITTRHLLVQKGSAADGFIVNVATTRPWGTCLDEPTSGDKAAVALLGCAAGTMKMVADAAVAVGDKVYTRAAGKVGAHATGAFLVGRAITAAAADGDIIEVAPIFPVLDASGTTL